MKATWIVLLVLAAVALVFALGIVGSATGDDDKKKEKDYDPPPWTERLGGWLSVDEPPGNRVPLRDLTVEPAEARPSPDLLVLAAGSAVQVRIPGDLDEDFRSLTLTVEPGLSIRVTMEIDGEEESEDFEPGEETTIAARRGGARFEVAALGTSGQARVRLE